MAEPTRTKAKTAKAQAAAAASSVSRISALDLPELLEWLTEHALLDFMPVKQMEDVTGQKVYFVEVRSAARA